VKLVSERPSGSWSVIDPSLELASPRLERKELAMPCHPLATRVLSRLAWGEERWPLAFARSILGWAGSFDLIYSRSMPVRAALLGARLKAVTGKPWIMHLSDPWADSPYRNDDPRASAKAHAEERACFELADAVALTTAEV